MGCTVFAILEPKDALNDLLVYVMFVFHVFHALELDRATTDRKYSTNINESCVDNAMFAAKLRTVILQLSIRNLPC